MGYRGVMNVRERRKEVEKMMGRGIAPSAMAELLGVHRRTISTDIRAIRKQLFGIGLRLGDWVEIIGRASYAFSCDGKAGVLTQIRLSDREVSVDLDPLRLLGNHPREQLFNVYDVRKLSDMEVLAKVSA